MKVGHGFLRDKLNYDGLPFTFLRSYALSSCVCPLQKVMQQGLGCRARRRSFDSNF